ncbi:hypothetical protein BKA69DRAFT_1065956 [Paraphysoderma sedebokerense]|nr:hypothetical protein BKA69DRAFT_1065956 [Paraphysoderma sedebokerense]
MTNIPLDDSEVASQQNSGLQGSNRPIGSISESPSAVTIQSKSSTDNDTMNCTTLTKEDSFRPGIRGTDPPKVAESSSDSFPENIPSTQISTDSFPTDSIPSDTSENQDTILDSAFTADADDASSTHIESQASSSSRSNFAFDTRNLRQRISSATSDAASELRQRVSNVAKDTMDLKQKVSNAAMDTINPAATVLRTKVISSSVASSPSTGRSIETGRTKERSSSMNSYNSKKFEDEANQSKQEPSEEKEKQKEKSTKEEGGIFECNICFDTASSPVVTLCGHLFCWPCLHSWFNVIPPHQPLLCPVCKAGSGRDKVIPVYARGKEPSDPRTTSSASASPANGVPPRPQPQRPEPDRAAGGFNFFDPFGANQAGGGGGFQFHAGVFPGVGFSWTFPNAGDSGGNQEMTEAQAQMHQLMTTLFFLFGFFIMFGIIFP